MYGLIACLEGILKEACVPKSTILKEAKVMLDCDNQPRPGDIVVLDYFQPDKNLLLDGGVTIVTHASAPQLVSRAIYALKHAEDRKL